jgi:hypothetical protein
MVNKALFRFGFVFFICIIGNNVQAQSPRRNWGMRVGLNAVSITSYKACQAGEVLENSSFTNKNGYFLTAFARFNINRIFLQPELAWNDYQRSCSFSFPNENNNGYYPSSELNIDSKAANANFLVGYNIVHDYPFLLGVFVGSSLIGTYRTNYSMDSGESFSRTDWLLNYSGILGFSINISRIYFDLRYEVSLPNANLDVNEISNFPDYYQSLTIKKTESILSFSFGVMF